MNRNEHGADHQEVIITVLPVGNEPGSDCQQTDEVDAAKNEEYHVKDEFVEMSVDPFHHAAKHGSWVEGLCKPVNTE